ncbi:MAG: hypothetical protein AAGD86_05585 [Pseudomonadota bacterium]
MPTGLGRYPTSLPLENNADASEYKVLLMGNSHAAGIEPALARLLALGQPDTPVEVRQTPGIAFLSDRVNDGVSEQTLESEPWSHVILQAQQYSTSNIRTYPTAAAEYWIRGSKQQGATPILFPEHPREGNRWEVQVLWDLHTGIAGREEACVAPVGYVWEEVLRTDPSLPLYLPDGNHASSTGVLLTALVFYQIITGQPVETLPSLAEFDVDTDTERLLKASVTLQLAAYAACNPPA